MLKKENQNIILLLFMLNQRGLCVWWDIYFGHYTQCTYSEGFSNKHCVPEICILVFGSSVGETRRSCMLCVHDGCVCVCIIDLWGFLWFSVTAPQPTRWLVEQTPSAPGTCGRRASGERYIHPPDTATPSPSGTATRLASPAHIHTP